MLFAPSSKPAYRVPTMTEIAAVAKDGPTHVSTFSGTGGTCCGFAMVGYRTLWANDCDPAAQACYRLNFPDVPLDPRPIQEIAGADIFRVTGLAKGDLDVFEGSPPCTAFSTAGKRDKGWGQVKAHAGAEQQVETLFFQWLRLLRELMPRGFSAENVAGLARGRAKGMHLAILKIMREIGYTVEARILDAQWLGVPQTRARLIYLGVRNDLGKQPTFPTPLPYRYSVRDALPHLYDQRLRLAYDTSGLHTPNGPEDVTDVPSPAITVNSHGGHHKVTSRVGAGAPRRDASSRVIHEAGANTKRVSHSEQNAPRVDVAHTGKHTRKGGLRTWRDGESPSPALVAGTGSGPEIRITRHGNEDRTNWADKARLADHAEADLIAKEGGAIRFIGKYGFKEHARSLEEPIPAVCADGPGFTAQDYEIVHTKATPGVIRRKLTIPEVMALCAFPPDFQLTGSFTQQWARLGNSVPPLMAAAIGRALRRVLED